MKKVAIITLFIVVLSLNGCTSREYPFPNKSQPVEKIDLLYNPYANNGNVGGPMENICTLEGEEAKAFITALYDMETDRCITPPPTGYGFYVARVVYKNGDLEMFGTRHIEFVENGSEPAWIGEYYFTGESFEELFFQYAKTGDGSPS